MSEVQEVNTFYDFTVLETQFADLQNFLEEKFHRNLQNHKKNHRNRRNHRNSREGVQRTRTNY